MEALAKIFKQTLWQILGKVVTVISSFIVLGAVARIYGEAGTGVFTLTTTYLSLFYLFADFGFNAYILKKAGEEGHDLKYYLGRLLGVRIIWAIILIIFAVGLLPFLPISTTLLFSAVLFGCFDILASAIFTTSNLIFQAKLRYDLMSVSILLGRSLGLVIFLYFASTKTEIPFLVLSYLSGGMIVSLVSLYFVKKLIKDLNPVFDFSYIKDLFKKTWPIALTLVLNVVYFRVDAFIIAYSKGNTDVGIYNIAYSVFQSALVLPAFIMNSYYPLMLKSLKAVKLMGMGLVGLASLGTIFTLLLAPVVIKILTGGGFVGSAQSLQILSLGFPAYFLSALLMWIMITKGQYKTMLGIYAAGLLINLVLNFIYIPQFSFLAASFITVVSEYLIVLLQMFALYWFRNIKG